MLSVLIVDDEKTICDGMAKAIPWEQLGIDTIKTANSAEEALAFVTIPDILITDIRMPRISGIELAGRIIKKAPLTKIVFMSAYSDKEYYRSAINLHAVGYIEKPINLTDAINAISDAVKYCLQHRHYTDQKKNLEEIERQKFCRSLIEGHNYEPTFDDELIKAFLSQTCFGSLYLKIHPHSMDREALKRLSQTLAMYLQQCFAVCFYTTIEKETVAFLIADSILKPHDHLSQRDKILLALDNITEKDRFFFAIGPLVKKPEDLKISWDEAIYLSRLLFFRGYGMVAFDSQKYRSYTDQFNIDPVFLKNVPALLRENKEDEFILGLQKTFREASKAINCPVLDVKKEFAKLLSLLNETGHMLLHDQTDDLYEIWEELDNIHTLLGIKDYVMTTAESFFIKIKDVSRYGEVVYSVIQELNIQIANPDFSVKTMAEKLHFRDTYLSALFKKKTGTTIIKYIFELRMEEAQRLLLSSKLKIGEIALQVGYRDVDYFTRVFKKHTGILPSDFRGGKRG